MELGCVVRAQIKKHATEPNRFARLGAADAFPEGCRQTALPQSTPSHYSDRNAHCMSWRSHILTTGHNEYNPAEPFAHVRRNGTMDR